MGNDAVTDKSTQGMSVDIRQLISESYSGPPDDYNADGAITKEDHWIRLAMDMERLEPHLDKVKAKAIQYWKQQASQKHPDASRHLKYWRGTRSLRRDFDAKSCFKASTARISDPSKVGLNITGNSPTTLLRLSLWGKAGQRIYAGRIAPLETYQKELISWAQTRPEGEDYRLQETCLWSKGRRDFLMGFQAKDQVWRPIEASHVNVDLPKHRITFQHNQKIPIRRVEVSFHSDSLATKRRGERAPLFRRNFTVSGQPRTEANQADSASLEGASEASRPAAARELKIDRRRQELWKRMNELRRERPSLMGPIVLMAAGGGVATVGFLMALAKVPGKATSALSDSNSSEEPDGTGETMTIVGLSAAIVGGGWLAVNAIHLHRMNAEIERLRDEELELGIIPTATFVVREDFVAGELRWRF